MFVSERLALNMLILLVLTEGFLLTVVLSSSNVINQDEVEQLHPTMLEKHGEISKATISKRSAMHFGNFSNYFQGEDLSACTNCGLFNCLQPKKCNFLIIKGDIVEPPNKYPWMVYLKITTRWNTPSFCGGAIISPNYILTAAHCLVHLAGPEGLTILFLTNTTSSYVPGPEVQQIIPHPEYNHELIKNDIALVKLKNKIICDRFKNPICLPPSDLKNPEGMVLGVAGWGATISGPRGFPKELREGKVKIVNYSRCANYFGGPWAHMGNIQYCSEGLEGNWQSTCNGDSGGPAFYKHDKNFYVMGVVSSSTEGCPEGYPIMFTAVPKYLNWINQVIKSSETRIY